MLNVEKYLTAIKEEIAKDACASKSCLIAKVRGDERPDCYDRTCRDCADASLDWLFSEYKEPPMLKNGDGLKPGDWIMVRYFNGQEAFWQKLKFVVFYKDYFYTESNASKDLIPWAKARLPEEGE